MAYDDRYRRDYDDEGFQSRYRDDDDYSRRSYRSSRYNNDRDHDRGMFQRGADEVKSWFGDDEAEMRRRRDERRDPDTWHAGGRDDDRYRTRSRYGNDYGSSQRGNFSGYRQSRGDYDYDYDRDRDYDYQQNRSYGSGMGAGLGAGAGGDRYGYAGSNTRYGDDYDRYDNDRDYDDRSHFGKGPKNDTRSKERIHDRICGRLHDADDLDASEIEVNTDGNGEVTLTGTALSRRDKRRAEDYAYNIRGVRHVQNNIRLSSDASNTAGAGSAKKKARETT